MTIVLKNLKYELPVPDCPWQVRVDRGYSILANPYKMKTKDDTERQFVVAHYTRYFKQKCEQQGEFLKELYKLYEIHNKYDKLELFCWCAPKLCHADVIKKFLDNAMDIDCYKGIL